MGAQRGNVLGLILRRASWLTATGLAFGLVLAFVLAHLVANLLLGVSPHDPVVFTVITVIIAALLLGPVGFPLAAPRESIPCRRSAANKKEETAMAIFRRFANLFRRSKVDHDINAELQAHIDLRMDANMAAGMSPEDARRDALLRFGNPTMTRERVAASDTTLSLAGLGRDVRYAVRQLWRSPGFALTAILTLALGIGANVVVFGVLNALILRPLDLPHVERLLQVEQEHPGYITQSYPDYLDFRARNSTFTDLAAFRINDVGLSSGGSAQRCWSYEVSGNYFDMLGVQPALGRFLHASDEHGPNSAPYIVLSDSFWRTPVQRRPSCHRHGRRTQQASLHHHRCRAAQL